MPRIHRRRLPAVAVALAVLATGAGLATMGGPDASAPGQVTLAAGAAGVRAGDGTAPGFHDARAGAPAVATDRAAAFGGKALVDLDATTGTPRMVARLDGFLTGTSQRAADDIVLDYVTAHLDGFGLEQRDLATLVERPTYVDVTGTRHLAWGQSFDGVEVFGHGLEAAVTASGRLLTVGGAPMPSRLVTPAAGGLLTTDEAAIRVARRDLGEKQKAPGPRDVAEDVLFVAGGTTYRAWETITMSAQNPALTVLDAGTGEVLYRRPLAADEHAPENLAEEAPEDARATGSRGIAYRFFPGSPRGGRQLAVNFTQRGWLPATATTLDGNNAHAFSDVDDDDLVQPTEEVGPVTGQEWTHQLRPFALGWASFCGNPSPCSWNPNQPGSWKKNRKQNATQAFFFVNSFHDHLAAPPIGFTEAAGNFQAVNESGQGLGGDAVQTHTSDGADSGNGLPDGNHVDTADMATPPDGQAPTMQLYLQHQPGTSYPAGDPYSPTNAGDAADTVYHEYAHGLSNRLVVDARGNSTLGGVQAGAMGEGWSDWYAMDHLVAEGFQKDLPDVADVRLFAHDGAGAGLDRTEPLDCDKGSTAAPCDGGMTGHRGGYTYADYGDVVGQPQVHADGEIWAQTLWDLRDALGSATSRSLVTRSMELAPANPSFLDVRNAILLADTAGFDGANRATIWSVFARRGMGFFAGSLGGDDSEPAADRRRPPTKVTTGVVTGTVRDADTGLPVPGVPVTLAFQGGAGVVNPTVLTGSDGRYQLGPVPVGTYRKLRVAGAGYDPVVTSASVVASGTTLDVEVRRNWAAASGGAVVSAFTGPDHSPECGPSGAIDGSLASGWGTTTGDDDGTPADVFVPKALTLDLTRAVDVTSFGVDPAATCGDGPSASTGGYRIETSPDAVTWTVAGEGTFTAEDRGRLNPVVPSAPLAGVRYVRFTILSNQTPDFDATCPDGAYSGCSWSDLTELTVYGSG